MFLLLYCYFFLTNMKFFWINFNYVEGDYSILHLFCLPFQLSKRLSWEYKWYCSFFEFLNWFGSFKLVLREKIKYFKSFFFSCFDSQIMSQVLHFFFLFLNYYNIQINLLFISIFNFQIIFFSDIVILLFLQIFEFRKYIIFHF